MGPPPFSAFSCHPQGKGPSKLLLLMPQSTSCPKAFLWLDLMGLVVGAVGAPLQGKGFPSFRQASKPH